MATHKENYSNASTVACILEHPLKGAPITGKYTGVWMNFRSTHDHANYITSFM